jgi:hypothetical protein
MKHLYKIIVDTWPGESLNALVLADSMCEAQEKVKGADKTNLTDLHGWETDLGEIDKIDVIFWMDTE